MSKDIPATLAQLRQWGVTELEGGLPKSLSAKAYQKMLKENGLRVVGVGANFNLLRDSLDQVVKNAKRLGATYVICYWIPHQGDVFTVTDADNAIAVFTKAGRYLRQKGLTLCYHNHGYEFVKHGDGTLFDYLAQRLPPDAVQFELDLMWAKHPGQDPTALLTKYAGRFPLVHLKDRRPGTPASYQGQTLRPANVPLGQGDIGLSAFLQEARRSGVKHLFIEDESLKPMEHIPQSISFLRDWEQHKDEIRLLVRADDLGMSHSANQACIAALQQGLARSVEVMAPTPWLPEAIQLLRQNPTADVGVHLVLTSEWNTLKWRPLTNAPSLIDSAGYFYTTTWKGNPQAPSLLDKSPNFDEAERELRAQIERVQQQLPGRVTHLSVHMAFDRSHPRLREIVEKLSADYGLPTLEPASAEPFPRFSAQSSVDKAERERAFATALEALKPGTYMLVTHPAYNTDDMQAIGDGKVGAGRDADVAMLTSQQVKEIIKKRGIQLIDYRAFQQKELRPLTNR